jgi:hypothetical protein
LVGKTRAQTKMRREKDFTFFTSRRCAGRGRAKRG